MLRIFLLPTIVFLGSCLASTADAVVPADDATSGPRPQRTQAEPGRTQAEPAQKPAENQPAPAENQRATVGFELAIRPILNEHCVACHGGVKQAAGLSFIHRDAALAAIEPGAPDESALIDRIISDDEDEVMPPPDHGARLSQEEVEVLTTWIKQGAKWQQPWSYEPPIVETAPAVSNPKWCQQPLDRFILARLDQESIKPAPRATPSQWLRRVTLDITGLPPTVEEHDQFLLDFKQSSKDAIEKKVDQLLRSPHYGERWASVWLDQIRYADSRGLGADGRREIWKYRDWVIDALNDDVPFDQFTVKQLAGDLLPQPTMGDLVATAANRLSQSNDEGGTDDEEFRIAAVLDRVSTVWQTWQGITIGCVQCHSHPYDPIHHEEFYQSVAFFNNTSDTDLSEEWPTLAVPLDPKDNATAERLDQKVERLEYDIWKRESAVFGPPGVAEKLAADWQDILELKASTNKETKVDIEVRQGKTEFYTVDTLSKDTDITLVASLPERLEQLTAVKLTILPRDPVKAISDSEWGFVLSHLVGNLVLPDGQKQSVEFSRVIGDEPHPFRNPQASLNGKSGSGFSAYSRINYPRQAVFLLKKPLPIEGQVNLELVLKHRVWSLGAFPLISRRGRLEVSGSDALIALLNDGELQTDRKRLKQLKAERQKIKSSPTPVMRERFGKFPRPTHVFIRGLFLTKGEEVFPGVPLAMPPLETEGPATRLDFARWLVNDENPLTARVTVNRIWARLFGIGIVATEEDFGSSGERPSHPQLLDHLALRFRDQWGWSQKELIRSIVLSSTYWQDSATRPELLDLDPQNRLVARGPRFRMPAEMVRDCALSASGLLSPRMHGPPVQPPIPDGIWKPFSGEAWKSPEPDNPDRYRRSLYTYTKRSIPYPMFAAFDAPSREFCSPRRLRSNTPLQALMTLNDTTFVECAKALAQKMTAVGSDLDQQLRYGFVSVASREPTKSELQTLRRFFKKCEEEKSEPNQQAAMESVASVLFNLDEIMSQ